MTITLSQFYSISPSDVELIAVDFTDTLSSTETLSSPTATVVVGSSVLTASNVAVNSGSTDILGRTVAVGKGVWLKVAGQTLGNTYRVRIGVATSSSPARTLNRDILFDCQ